MNYFRNLMSVILLVTAPSLVFSQVKPLDATLSDYQYPYEVRFSQPEISE